ELRNCYQLNLRSYIQGVLTVSMPGPPGDCGGAWGFMELAEEYSLPKIYSKLRAVLEKYQSGKASRNHFEQMIEDLEYWINREKVNKQRINEELREYLLTKDQEATI
ncbi:hypothetical protein NF27_AS00010, partial [Candidatus Jidaibacter acanthamoeba]